MLKEEKLFNVRINCFDYKTLEENISLAFQNGKQMTICYVNFFSVNIAKNDLIFRDIINSNDIIFPDGTGIWMGLKLIGNKIIKKRFNLTDYGYTLLNFCSKNNFSIFMYGGNPKVLEKLKLQVKKIIPNLVISGMIQGYTNKSDDEIVEIINKSNSLILMVGLGTPKQEKWIYENKTKLKPQIILSIGDLFGLFAGKKKRGPKIIQNLGLEWAVRLITDPRRYYRRYLLGIPKFIIYVIQEFLKRDHKL